MMMAAPVVPSQIAQWLVAKALTELQQERAAAAQARQVVAIKRDAWPARHVMGLDGRPVPFHRPQQIAFDARQRIVAMLAGTQSGKTSWGPWWLLNEIEQCGSGDYFAVTASFDLFKLKMLPAMLETFETILGIGRYWAQDRVIELRDPLTGAFRAKTSKDPMWARIILRSAEAANGLESGTGKGAWLDEAGQDGFEVNAWRAVLRRLSLHQGRILITTTLYNLGWLKNEVIDPAEKSGVKTVETLDNGAEIETTVSTTPSTVLVQFDSIVNPVFPKEEYEAREASMPADEFAMLYRGRVTKLRILIYNCFEARRDKCPRFDIPKTWKRYLGLDFGGVHTAGVFFAEEPETKKLYAYREYLEGGKTGKEHAKALLEGEPMVPVCVGGSQSEDQWRKEFRAGGLPVREPEISEVDLGITRVYGAMRRGEIVWFDDLAGTLDQIGKYRRKRDKSGEITQEIENKNAFHFLDSVRYIIGWLKPEEKPKLQAGENPFF
jgi:hypothetical protein